ncbi:MAG: response regulator [Candidatus Moraniibacteriota bacterium]
MKDSKKILIVEDETPMARALAMKFKKEGFETEISNNGKEALELIKKRDFDLVLLDLIMPEEDGFHVLNQVKEEKINAKIIISSNLSQQEDINRAKKLGAVDYFVKSDTPIVEVVRKVKENLEE